ncbi:MAG: type II toxin-antitoxin system prevent-host-death family antitoxin [Fimbriimonadaceae bacterium]|nr:type II toxin-antitoxin system prevent-host-death family antitoxin [Fimbriimonadaceae bacterium]
MVKVNVQEAKTHLSQLIKRAQAGERIVLCVRNEPAVELTVVTGNGAKRPLRPLGLGKGLITYMAPDFDAPMSEEELAEWERPIEL